MTEDAAQPQQPVMPRMQVLGQYIRDMSFENVLAQKGVQGEVQPDINVEVALDANQFEVITKFTVNSKNKNGGEQLFLLELEYAGIFHIENVPEDQMHPFLLIECPRMLFPFVRRVVSDITRDGGFPPLNLDTVDFMALYRAEIERRAAAEKEGQPIS